MEGNQCHHHGKHAPARRLKRAAEKRALGWTEDLRNTFRCYTQLLPLQYQEGVGIARAQEDIAAEYGTEEELAEDRHKRNQAVRSAA